MTSGPASSDPEPDVDAVDAVDAVDVDGMWRQPSSEPAADGAAVEVAEETSEGEPAESTSRDDSGEMASGASAPVVTRSDVVDDESAISPWRVGSEAIFAPTRAAAFEVTTAPSAATGRSGEPPAAPQVRRVVVDGEVIALPSQRSMRRWLVTLVVGMIAVALIVVVRSVVAGDLEGNVAVGFVGPNATEINGAGDGVVTSGEFVEPLVDEPFAGADRRRLPAQLDQRWSVDLVDVAATSGTRLEVLDDGSVIGVFEDRSADDGGVASILVALDADDGSQRWRSQFDSSARDLSVLAAIGDVVVLERRAISGQSLLGVSAATGEVLWADEIDRAVSYSVAPGTSLVARDSSTEFPPVSFIDPATGEELGRPAGRQFAIDFLGTVFLREGADVFRLNLQDGWNPPVRIGELRDDDGSVSVVDGRVVAIVDGSVEVRNDDGTPRRAEIVGSVPGRYPATFTDMAPMGDNAIVLIGASAAFGAELLEDGDIAIRWRASGTPIGFRPTDRGASIIMATEGGGEQRVIDGSTGREVTSVDMVPGAIDVLQLVGNGVVVKRAATVGSERVGLDLDGNLLWSLAGNGPLFVGRGVVATYAESDGGLVITAYGDVVP